MHKASKADTPPPDGGPPKRKRIKFDNGGAATAEAVDGINIKAKKAKTEERQNKVKTQDKVKTDDKVKTENKVKTEDKKGSIKFKHRPETGFRSKRESFDARIHYAKCSH